MRGAEMLMEFGDGVTGVREQQHPFRSKCRPLTRQPIAGACRKLETAISRLWNSRLPTQDALIASG